MGFAIHGKTVTEFSKETGPDGRALMGESVTGLTSHQEAREAVKERVRNPAGSSVGFADTPEVKAALDSLRKTSGKKKRTGAGGEDFKGDS